jgi:hypothetical protein
VGRYDSSYIRGLSLNRFLQFYVVARNRDSQHTITGLSKLPNLNTEGGQQENEFYADQVGL